MIDYLTCPSCGHHRDWGYDGGGLVCVEACWCFCGAHDVYDAVSHSQRRPLVPCPCGWTPDSPSRDNPSRNDDYPSQAFPRATNRSGPEPPCPDPTDRPRPVLTSPTSPSKPPRTPSDSRPGRAPTRPGRDVPETPAAGDGDVAAGPAPGALEPARPGWRPAPQAAPPGPAATTSAAAALANAAAIAELVAAAPPLGPKQRELLGRLLAP